MESKSPKFEEKNLDMKPTNSASYLLGIDNGLTMTKAVVFNVDGVALGVGSVRTVANTPHPRWTERDMLDIWGCCVKAIRIALEKANVDVHKIVAVGVTAHGDGVYMIDHDGEPVRPGILSLDSRAWDTIQMWKDNNVMDTALELTGQYPNQAAPATLLAWVKKFEPENYERIQYFMFCKDWIRFKLTGQVATDPTEASTSFTNVMTQQYSPAIFSLFELDELASKAPPILSPLEFAGKITHAAAIETGLLEGTPVGTGLHDVDACALGTGCFHPGQLSAIAGTYSINQVISSMPVLSKDWACRNFLTPGLWNCMSISPASATNLEWFVRELCPSEIEKAQQMNLSAYAFVNEEIEKVLDEEICVFFLPFIYGSPHGEKANAGFMGIRGWHTRAHLLKAIYEGVVFNHKTHIDFLRAALPVTEVRLAGGGAKSKIWSQMFADALNLRTVVTDAEETGALGTAICAGFAAGLYSSLESAVANTVRVLQVYEPNSDHNAKLSKAYDIYAEIIRSMAPAWQKME
jgi:L-xylulokinase